MTVRISSVEGNRQLLDGGAMFGNAPRPVWEKWIAPDHLGRIPLACRSLLIENHSIKILCETGIGAFFEPKLADRYGVQSPDRHLLLENLARLKVKPDEIDFVILSHLHFDHAGGLLPTYNDMQSGHRELVFPKAKFIVSATAWERALNPHPRDRASFIPELTERLKSSGRLIIYPNDPLPAALKPHVEFIETQGHTPGHLHTLFKGNSGHVFFCGDLVPGKPWVHVPITMGYDRYPELLIDEKNRVFERASLEKWLMFYTHDPVIAASKIEKQSSGRFVPTEDNPSLDRTLI